MVRRFVEGRVMFWPKLERGYFSQSGFRDMSYIHMAMSCLF